MYFLLVQCVAVFILFKFLPFFLSSQTLFLSLLSAVMQLCKYDFSRVISPALITVILLCAPPPPPIHSFLKIIFGIFGVLFIALYFPKVMAVLQNTQSGICSIAWKHNEMLALLFVDTPKVQGALQSSHKTLSHLRP